MQQDKVYLNQVGVVCAAADNLSDLKIALMQDKPAGMTRTDAFGSDPLPLAMCCQTLPAIPFAERQWHSRNNQLALLVFEQIRADVAAAVKQFGRHRVGVVIGTSTSGISDAEVAIESYVTDGALPADYHYSVQEMANTAEFIAKLADVTGPVYAISTACSSGAKALASAKRLITAGLCDAVIAGGVDTLCKLTVQGFSALEAVSKAVCNPFSRNRDGINIGEAGALFVLSRDARGVCLAGVGESSDAHHISAPDPEGKGAEQSMCMALLDAEIAANEVSYINLHGTATPLNDQMESLAVSRVFPADVPCSSTKPFTGHTLGAAGAMEAAICWLALTEHDLLPAQHWDNEADPILPQLNLVSPQSKPTNQLQWVLSNSFAFGGNNISLLMSRIK